MPGKGNIGTPMRVFRVKCKHKFSKWKEECPQFGPHQKIRTCTLCKRVEKKLLNK